MKRVNLILSILLTVITSSLSSCNTFYGLGKDMQIIGGKMASTTRHNTSSSQQSYYQQPKVVRSSHHSRDTIYGPADLPPSR